MGPILNWIQILPLPLTGYIGKFLDLSGPFLLLKRDDRITLFMGWSWRL